MRSSQDLPERWHACSTEVIERIAPSGPGIVYFKDKAGDLWFADETEDLKNYLLMIRNTPQHPRRQGVAFACEERADSVERQRR